GSAEPGVPDAAPLARYAQLRVPALRGAGARRTPDSPRTGGAAMAKTPEVGEQAPDFELPGTDGTFRLSDHRGERRVLLFSPGDNTMVCTKQFCSYRDRPDEFAALNATVLGISSQDLASHQAFTAKHGLTVPLLADVDKQVAKSYDAFSPRVGVKRAVIVIDEGGILRYRH